MLIQKTAQYSYNPNLAPLSYKKSTTSINFCGEAEDEFVKGFEQIQDENEIAQYVKDSDINKLNSIKMSSFADILGKLFGKIKELKNEEKQLTQRDSNIGWLIYTLQNKIAKDTLEHYNKTAAPADAYIEPEDKLGKVAEILNKYSSKLYGGDERTPDTIIETLENSIGYINSDMLKFLEIVLQGGKQEKKTQQKKDIKLVLKAINMVKDRNGNLDLEKASTFKALYDINGATLLSALDTMDEIYPSDKVMTQEEINKLRQKEKIQNEELKKVHELAKKLNSYRTKDEKQIMEATIDEDGLINICMNIDAEFDFKPEKYGCDNNWAFEHIRSIDCVDLDLSNCKQLTSTGALELVQGCVAVKNREQQREFDYFRNVVVSMIIYENTHYGQLK